MRKQLLLSTGIICLMLAPAVSYGQAPGARGEEQKQMRPSEGGKGAASQERGAERAQERGQGAEHKAQGAAGREEKGVGSRQTEERGKAAPTTERPATASDDKRGRNDDAKSSERAQDSRHSGRDAQPAREGRDAKDSTKDTSAIIYSKGTWRDVNTLIAPVSGWFLSVANGINASGQIVGTGFHNGAERAFVLTPQ